MKLAIHQKGTIKLTNINAALGKPLVNDSNYYQTEASTEIIIGGNNAQLVKGTQPNNQLIDISSDSL